MLFSEHHLSHAASAFFCSPFEEAAILTVDGVGEWATATMGIGAGQRDPILTEIRFPHSLGLLYSAFTAYLGFEVNEGEYKVMGMAPVRQAPVRGQGPQAASASATTAASGWTWTTSRSTTRRATRTTSKFVELFGPERPAAMHFFTAPERLPLLLWDRSRRTYEQLASRNEYYADVAASIQAVTEEVVLKMARTLHRATGLPGCAWRAASR